MSEKESESEVDDGGHQQYSDWDEPIVQPTKDLFSYVTFPSCEECLEYMKNTYNFDLKNVISSRNMDLFSAVKYVNYVRSMVVKGAEYGDKDWKTIEVPDDESYLVSVVESDPLLQLVDMEDDVDEDNYPTVPTVLKLIQDEFKNSLEQQTSEDFAFLDKFCYRQFDDPDFAGLRIRGVSKEEFTQKVNQYYLEKRNSSVLEGVSLSSWLADGYAPFCKHIFMPNFLENCTVPVANITPENEHLLKSGYISRTEKELPVLSRWFPKGSVPEQPAQYLDVILYSREQIIKENIAMNEEITQHEEPWGIISVKAQLEPYEIPMQPITLMRNALIQEGGSGVDIDREAYRRSVEYWKTRAIIM